MRGKKKYCTSLVRLLKFYNLLNNIAKALPVHVVLMKSDQLR